MWQFISKYFRRSRPELLVQDTDPVQNRVSILNKYLVKNGKVIRKDAITNKPYYIEHTPSSEGHGAEGDSSSLHKEISDSV